MVAVVQLVRASDCGSECRGFESHLPPNKKEVLIKGTSFFHIYIPQWLVWYINQARPIYLPYLLLISYEYIQYEQQ